MRYDGGSCTHKGVVRLTERLKANVISICPESLAGLSIPRPPAELDFSSFESMGRVSVYDKAGKNVTDEFEHGAQKALEIAQQEEVVLAILKERSPSCASQQIYDGSFNHIIVEGEGLATHILRNAGIPVVSEEIVERYEVQAGRYVALVSPVASQGDEIQVTQPVADARLKFFSAPKELLHEDGYGALRQRAHEEACTVLVVPRGDREILPLPIAGSDQEYLSALLRLQGGATHDFLFALGVFDSE